MSKSTLQNVLLYELTIIVAMSAGCNVLIVLLSLKTVFADSGKDVLNK